MSKNVSFSESGKFELYILSAINFPTGIEGKKLWIQSHTKLPLDKAIIVSYSADKAKYAGPDSSSDKCRATGNGKIVCF